MQADSSAENLSHNQKRKQISARTRFEIFKRDGFVCQYCGATPPATILHVDHIDPVANGGKNNIDNLVTSCVTCNLGKSAVLLTSIPQSLSAKAAEVAEREKQLRGYHQVLKLKEERIEDETWQIIEILNGAPIEFYDRRNILSIRKFLDELPFFSVYEAAMIAAARFSGRSGFRYFCGICWRRMKGDF